MFLSLPSIVLCLIILPRWCSSFSFDSKWKILQGNNNLFSNANSNNEERKKRKVNGKIPVLSRIVPIGNDQIPSVTIWELQNPSKLMEMWWAADGADPATKISKEKIGDPFGVVFWPGSILASQELINHAEEVANSTVLVLGAGTGVEAQVSAMLNAKKVIATDISSLTLKLLRYGADQASLGDRIETLQFDLFSRDELPACDIMVAADVLYNEELAEQVGARCVEVLSRPNPPKVLVTDSQRFHGTDFIDEVNEKLRSIGKELHWDYYLLENVTGSGVLIEGDQTYDAKIRMISDGWS